MRNHKLTQDDKRSLHHALIHLEANEVDTDGDRHWYTGNRKHFVARHLKAKALLQRLIQEE